MSQILQPAQIAWGEGDIPTALRFDDPYFSRHDGAEETKHVFLCGNDLLERWQNKNTFHIAELGFGTGLNMLVAWRAFLAVQPNSVLHFTSFERYPMAYVDMCRALKPYPDLLAKLIELGAFELHEGVNKICGQGLELNLIIGDANETLPRWQGMADAWFLDGFSPAKNPDLWSGNLMQAVFDRTRAGGSFATYTAAGWVKRNLQAAGFKVIKAKGFAYKRDMLRGLKP